MFRLIITDYGDIDIPILQISSDGKQDFVNYVIGSHHLDETIAFIVETALREQLGLPKAFETASFISAAPYIVLLIIAEIFGIPCNEVMQRALPAAHAALNPQLIDYPAGSITHPGIRFIKILSGNEISTSFGGKLPPTNHKPIPTSNNLRQQILADLAPALDNRVDLALPWRSHQLNNYEEFIQALSNVNAISIPLALCITNNSQVAWFGHWENEAVEAISRGINLWLLTASLIFDICWNSQGEVNCFYKQIYPSCQTDVVKKCISLSSNTTPNMSNPCLWKEIIKETKIYKRSFEYIK